MNASSFDQILKKVVVVPVAALLGGALILAWQIQAANATVSLIEQHDIRIKDTIVLEKLVIDEETGLRGYEITHDPRLLVRYYEARQALPGAFAERRALANNDQRRQAIDTIRSAHETWEEAFADPLIATIKAGGATNDVTLNLEGKRMMDDVRKRIGDLNILTEQVRTEAIQRWRDQVRTMIAAIIAFAVLIGLVIGLYVRRLMEQVSRAFRHSHEAMRMRAEQTFRSEEKLRATLESIGEGVITCDAEGRVQSLNDAAQSMTGWSEAEARNQPLSLVFPACDETTNEPIESPVTRVLRSNQRMQLQNHTMLRRRDGTDLYIEESGSPIRDKDAAAAGVVIVFRDVTLQRKSQAALLANEKLAVAGRLAASIAHEIHNPLDSVSNLLFLMDGVASDVEREQFLKLAKQEIARVTQISRAMLSLYRESRSPVSIDIGEMLGSILLLLDSRFRVLRVETSAELPEHLCVEGFPAELRQVFTNLLTNAAEASGPEGKVSLVARAVASSPANPGKSEPGVLVTITDNGPGVPAEVLPQLFQPFFTTKGERGTGLGLWISRGIVTKHGGTISLESSTDPDKHGTTLRVFLSTHPVITFSSH